MLNLFMFEIYVNLYVLKLDKDIVSLNIRLLIFPSYQNYFQLCCYMNSYKFNGVRLFILDFLPLNISTNISVKKNY